jgi:hypothetical protein
VTVIKSENVKSELALDRVQVSAGTSERLDLSLLAPPRSVGPHGGPSSDMASGAEQISKRALEAFSSLEQLSLPAHLQDVEAYGKGLRERLDTLQRLSRPDVAFEIENPPTTNVEALEAVMQLNGFARGLPSEVVEGLKGGKLSHLNGVTVSFSSAQGKGVDQDSSSMRVYSLIPWVSVPGGLPNLSRVVSSLAHRGTIPESVRDLLSAVELAVERGPIHYARTWGALAVTAAGFVTSAWLGFAGFEQLASLGFTLSFGGPALLNRWDNPNLHHLKWLNAADRIAMSPWSHDPFNGALPDREVLFGKQVQEDRLDAFTRKSRDSLRALRHLGIPEEEINRAVYSTAYDSVRNEAVEVERLLKFARRNCGLSNDATFKAVIDAKESMLEVERGISRRLARAIASTYLSALPESQWYWDSTTISLRDRAEKSDRFMI